MKAIGGKSTGRLHVGFAAFGLFCLLSYLLIVLALGETVAGVEVGVPVWLVLELMAFGLSFSSFTVPARRRTLAPQRLLATGLTLVTLTACFVAADMAAFVLVPSGPKDSGMQAAESDGNHWLAEIYPRPYYPTDANFRLLKPSTKVHASHFGGFYAPYMLDSPTLASRVLEKQEVEISINELGFRETDALDSCRVLALGDSFTFGYGVTGSAIWPELLQNQIGECVYNLGVGGASPKQELELLKYILSSESPPPVERLIWMFCEANDLEDSYADERPRYPGQDPWEKIEHTVVGGVIGTILSLKTESIIDRLRQGTLRFDTWQSGPRFEYVVDGVETPYPILHSDRLGYLLLYPADLTTAFAGASYVENHPNRAALERVFMEMRALSMEKGFEVTVAMAPYSLVPYAPYFSPLNTVRVERHFARQVEALAKSSGFETIDLLALMRPAAETQMLYFRDDDHWSPLGHEIVAAGLASKLAE